MVKIEKNINPKVEAAKLVRMGDIGKVQTARLYYLTDIIGHDYRMAGTYSDYRQAIKICDNFLLEKKDKSLDDKYTPYTLSVGSNRICKE